MVTNNEDNPYISGAYLGIFHFRIDLIWEAS